MLMGTGGTIDENGAECGDLGATRAFSALLAFPAHLARGRALQITGSHRTRSGQKRCGTRRLNGSNADVSTPTEVP